MVLMQVFEQRNEIQAPDHEYSMVDELEDFVSVERTFKAN